MEGSQICACGLISAATEEKGSSLWTLGEERVMLSSVISLLSLATELAGKGERMQWYFSQAHFSPNPYN